MWQSEAHPLSTLWLPSPYKARCINCGGPHPTTEPRWQQERQVYMAASRERISRREARRGVLGPRTRSARQTEQTCSPEAPVNLGPPSLRFNETVWPGSPLRSKTRGTSTHFDPPPLARPPEASEHLDDHPRIAAAAAARSRPPAAAGPAFGLSSAPHSTPPPAYSAMEYQVDGTAIGPAELQTGE